MKNKMKQIIKGILKANSWYDNLKEPNRSILFLIILISIIGSQFIFNNILTWAIFTMTLVGFRMMPTIYKLFKLYKNEK
jgi:hypothetical protein